MKLFPAAKLNKLNGINSKTIEEGHYYEDSR
jgi:hypothetical protein